MISFFKILLLVTLMSLLSACPLVTRDDIEKQEDEKQLKEQVATIQKNRADSEVKYSDLQSDLKVVAGRVDTIDHALQTGHQTNHQEIENLKKMIEAQNEKIKLIEQHMDATETRLMAAIQAGTTAPAATGPSAKENSFDEGQKLFEAREFKRALVKFQSYLDKNPKGNRIGETTYLMGVCFSEIGLKKEAKDSYKDTIENYPGTPWAKKAKYRLSHLK